MIPRIIQTLKKMQIVVLTSIIEVYSFFAHAGGGMRTLGEGRTRWGKDEVEEGCMVNNVTKPCFVFFF